MSRRKSPESVGSNTRQMLDELDVLMEKMLALPVNQLEDHVEPAPARSPSQHPAAASPTPPLSQFQKHRERAEPPPVESPVSQVLVGQLAILHSPATHGALPSPKSPTREDRAAAVALVGAPLQQDTAIDGYGLVETAPEYLPPLSSLAPAVAGTPLPPAPRYSLRFHPLLWINQGFDLLTRRLGMPGSWLRHSGGRAVLGMLGLLFLAVALTWWLKETLGWSWLWESVE